MNTLLQIPNRKFLITAIAFFITSLFSIQVLAQCSAPSLKFHSPVLLSGLSNQAGAIYLFKNVIPGVDARIEIVGLFGGAVLSNIDDSSGYYDAFQPYVTAPAHDTSYIDWKITFKVAGTNTDIALACLAVTGIDVDGSGSKLREFIEAATPGSIAVDPATTLTVSFDGVRSKAISTVATVPQIDTAHREAMFQMNFTNISTLLYRNGAISINNSPLVRQTCIYFKPFFQNSTFTVLPVKILSFTAKSTEDLTRLEWSASNENDIRNYTIEKSADGKIWKDIQTIHPGSSSTINHYFAIDLEKMNSNSYYRLKLIDIRGLVNYSKLIKISNQNDIQKSITHNTLVKNTLNLQIYGTANDEYTVDYYSLTGSKIKQDKFRIHPGMNSASVQFTSQISPGLYFLVVKNNKGQQVYSSRFTKN